MKRTEKQIIKTEVERNMAVCQRDDMINLSRYTLSVQEQRCVYYVIAQINPGDTSFTEYTFDIKELYRLCGIENESYTRLKQTLIGLKSKCWWITLPDGSESAVSWFNTIHLNKKSGTVTIKLHEDMMPFLLNLARQAALGNYFTAYSLKFILPMSSRFSPRLYELLKSHQKNNREWYFDLDELKHRLNVNYPRWPDLRRYVLDPAVDEINKYSDIKVRYEPVKEGRKVVRVWFYMAKKTEAELSQAGIAGSRVLDGNGKLEYSESCDFKNSLFREDFWGDRAKRQQYIQPDALHKDPDGWAYPTTLDDYYGYGEGNKK